jgi:hypothetical protein
MIFGTAIAFMNFASGPGANAEAADLFNRKENG